jgi:hypothetical protein
MNHLALFLLLPAAVLAWRWSRLVSAALWLTLAVWLAYRSLAWRWPEAHADGAFEVMRYGASAATGFLGLLAFEKGGNETRVRRQLVLGAMLIASMAVDLAALLVHRAWGQWGPQPFFQCLVLLAMCVVAWPIGGKS